MIGLLRDAVSQLEPQLHLTGDHDGVGEVRGVGRLVIVVSVVAEELCDACALCIERSNAEGVAAMDKCVVECALYQCVADIGETDVGDGVEREEMVHLHVITHLCLLGVAARHFLIVHPPVEIAVIAQHALRHLCMKCGVDIAHQHGLLAYDTRHPLAELGI